MSEIKYRIQVGISPSTHRELGQALDAALKRARAAGKVPPPSRWARFLAWLRGGHR